MKLWIITSGDYEATNIEFLYFSKKEAFKRFDKIYNSAYFPRNKRDDYFDHDESSWTKIEPIETEDDLDYGVDLC